MKELFSGLKKKRTSDTVKKMKRQRLLLWSVFPMQEAQVQSLVREL